MDIIEAARQLGKAIQSDERYIKLIECRNANDNDENLQNLIGEFNLVRMQASEEAEKDENRDDEKFKQLNARMRQLYLDIMNDKKMQAYNDAKGEFDAVMQRMRAIIDMCVQGQDPDTCEPSSECTGDCSSCGGCH